ncbi:MAG: roadblock/LC7 domain-containing protein [Gemmatimonadaceae bacterium]
MSSSYAPLLASIVRQRGVHGALLVGERDGLVVDADLQTGVEGRAVAALAASLFRRARLSSSAAGLGGVTFVRLDAEHGHVCAAGRGELVLVSLVEAGANLGLVRAAMLKAAQGLS